MKNELKFVMIMIVESYAVLVLSSVVSYVALLAKSDNRFNAIFLFIFMILWGLLQIHKSGNYWVKKLNIKSKKKVKE